VALHNGFDRLMTIGNSDEFVFVVNGETVKSTVQEAVLLSPAISERLKLNPGDFTFTIKDDRINSSDFVGFLKFFRSRVWRAISQSEALSFLSIAGLLGNDEMSFAMIELSSEVVEKSDLNNDSISPEGIGLKLINIDARDCASVFYRYSSDSLRRLSKALLHEVLSSPFLELESEDSFLQTLLDLGSDYQEFWDYIEVGYLTENGISLFLDALPFENLNESIWRKIVERLRGLRDDDMGLRRYRARSDAATVKARPGVLDSTIGDIDPTILRDVGAKSWELLYRGSIDGFMANDFHRKCDGQSHTLMVIETTKGFIFGGYTPVQWDSSNSPKPDPSKRSFLFTMKNPHSIAARKFSLYNAKLAIYCSSRFGPILGGNGPDVRISNGCNKNTDSCTKLGSAYVNDTGIDGKEVFAGEPNFVVKEIEVFKAVF
jgi:hypothetical protein